MKTLSESKALVREQINTYIRKKEAKGEVGWTEEARAFIKKINSIEINTHDKLRDAIEDFTQSTLIHSGLSKTGITYLTGWQGNSGLKRDLEALLTIIPTTDDYIAFEAQEQLENRTQQQSSDKSLDTDEISNEVLRLSLKPSTEDVDESDRKVVEKKPNAIVHQLESPSKRPHHDDKKNDCPPYKSHGRTYYQRSGEPGQLSLGAYHPHRDVDEPPPLPLIGCEGGFPNFSGSQPSLGLGFALAHVLSNFPIEERHSSSLFRVLGRQFINQFDLNPDEQSADEPTEQSSSRGRPRPKKKSRNSVHSWEHDLD